MRPSNVTAALLRGWPVPLHSNGSKDQRGSAFVIAGSAQMPGPAILAATAVLRAGAGKLQIATSESVALHIATAVPEALVVSLERADVTRHANGADAVVAGPGMDSSQCADVVTLLAPRLRVPAVFDAAALNCLSDDAQLLASCGERAILTPHAGEMAAMLRCERDAVEKEPIAHVMRAVERFGTVVVLKGAYTYIAGPKGELFCNKHGHVGLATSGSGDTLAGVIGGILARGASPVQAAVWGVYLHAKAGARLAKRVGVGFLARELLAEIPLVMNRL